MVGGEEIMTGNELATRAYQIADLVNSNYIQDTEMVSMINEVWCKAYADLVNINDSYFLEMVNPSVGSNDEIDLTTLRPKFMLLDSVSYIVGLVGREPLKRRAKGDAAIYGTYDLYKTKLRLNRYSGKTVELTYYPEAQKISVLTDNIDLPSNIFEQYLAYVLAIQMKSKQGADYSALSSIAQTKFETYQQLLNRDIYGPVRVTNVYQNYWGY